MTTLFVVVGAVIGIAGNEWAYRYTNSNFKRRANWLMYVAPVIGGTLGFVLARIGG
jgi:hypothetical protein